MDDPCKPSYRCYWMLAFVLPSETVKVNVRMHKHTSAHAKVSEVLSLQRGGKRNPQEMLASLAFWRDGGFTRRPNTSCPSTKV